MHRAAMAMALALCGCDRAPDAATNRAEPVSMAQPTSASEFPQKGDYDVVRESDIDGRKQSTIHLDVSYREAFAEQFARDDGSNCRDRRVEIGGGSFSVSMTCDAPDGDIHNIGSESHGTYSRDGIDVTSEIRLFGSPMRETVSYRLRRE